MVLPQADHKGRSCHRRSRRLGSKFCRPSWIGKVTRGLLSSQDKDHVWSAIQ